MEDHGTPLDSRLSADERSCANTPGGKGGSWKQNFVARTASADLKVTAYVARHTNH